MTTFRVVVERVTAVRETVDVEADTFQQATAIAQDHAAGTGSPRYMRDRVQMVTPAQQHSSDERVISVREK